MTDKIPEGWKKVKLGNVAEIIMGQSPPSSTYNDNGEGLPFYQGVVDFGYRFVTPRVFCTEPKKVIDENYVLLSVRAPVGEVNLTREKCAIGRGNAGLKAKNGQKLFFYYLLKYNMNNLKNSSEGTVFASINKSTIENLEIKIPESLEEQKAIAAVLSSLDDKIDLLHHQNKTLEAMAETLFRKWFIEDAKEDWEVINFGEIVRPKRGKNITKSKTIAGLYPVVAGGIEPSCYHNEYNTLEPVVTISASGANAGYVRLYHSKVWASDCSYIDYSVTPYLYFSYVFLKINQHILFDKQTGSAQPHIYPTQIMELELCNYPEELMIKFENWCKNIFNKIKLNKIQIRTLENLRDTLLPKLMSGQVKVRI